MTTDGLLRLQFNERMADIIREQIASDAEKIGAARAKHGFKRRSQCHELACIAADCGQRLLLVNVLLRGLGPSDAERHVDLLRSAECNLMSALEEWR